MANIDWMSIGKNIIAGICSGIADVAGDLIDSAVGAVSDAWDALTNWLDINSPSRKARRVIGRNWALGIGVGFEESMPEDEMLNAQKSVFDKLSDAQDDFNFPEITGNPDRQRGGVDGGGNGILGSVYELLIQYLPLLANMQIVLQEGTLVGKLAPGMNEELGKIARWEAAR